MTSLWLTLLWWLKIRMCFFFSDFFQTIVIIYFRNELPYYLNCWPTTQAGRYEALTPEESQEETGADRMKVWTVPNTVCSILPYRVGEKLACTVCMCVCVTNSEGLHLEQGGACRGSEVGSQAKEDWSPSSLEGQNHPTAASHNMRRSHSPSLHFFLLLSPLFFFSFGEMP